MDEYILDKIKQITCFNVALLKMLVLLCISTILRTDKDSHECCDSAENTLPEPGRMIRKL
jgi:hypothetical protein